MLKYCTIIGNRQLCKISELLHMIEKSITNFHICKHKSAKKIFYTQNKKISNANVKTQQKIN